jgi:hypothetical protein
VSPDLGRCRGAARIPMSKERQHARRFARSSPDRGIRGGAEQLYAVSHIDDLGSDQVRPAGTGFCETLPLFVRERRLGVDEEFLGFGPLVVPILRDHFLDETPGCGTVKVKLPDILLVPLAPLAHKSGTLTCFSTGDVDVSARRNSSGRPWTFRARWHARNGRALRPPVVLSDWTAAV